MATRTRPLLSKQVVIRGDLHAKIKRLCFENEVQMKDLINLMLSSVLDDEVRIEQILADLQSDRS